jgi:hypothetical protein
MHIHICIDSPISKVWIKRISKLSFRCLSNGEVPPVKDRLEYPPPETEFGLTPGWEWGDRSQSYYLGNYNYNASVVVG